MIQAREEIEQEHGRAVDARADDVPDVVAEGRADDGDDEACDGEQGADAVGDSVENLLVDGLFALFGRGLALQGTHSGLSISDAKWRPHGESDPAFKDENLMS